MKATALTIAALLDTLVGAFQVKDFDTMYGAENDAVEYYKEQLGYCFHTKGEDACAALLAGIIAMFETKDAVATSPLARRVTRCATILFEAASPIRQEYIRLLEANGYWCGGDDWYKKEVGDITHYAWLWGADRLKMCGEHKPTEKSTYFVSPDEEMTPTKLQHILDNL